MKRLPRPHMRPKGQSQTRGARYASSPLVALLRWLRSADCGPQSASTSPWRIRPVVSGTAAPQRRSRSETSVRPLCLHWATYGYPTRLPPPEVPRGSSALADKRQNLSQDQLLIALFDFYKRVSVIKKGILTYRIRKLTLKNS